jgi:hypothetical protein
MGQWGTHFDRTQTWWNDFTAMVKYWQRCQALLQWGKIVENADNDFAATINQGQPIIQSIHRSNATADVYFVANISHEAGSVTCTFNISGKQPELWDPVTGEMRDLPLFTEVNGKTSLLLPFADAQSFFIVFRNKISRQHHAKNNFPAFKEIMVLHNPWQVQFDNKWGGPAQSVRFDSLTDWTNRPEPGIKYYSGTASYFVSFDMTSRLLSNKKQALYLDLGVVKDMAHVILNDKDLGVVWTAPWQIKIPAGLLKKKGNKLEIRITNTWANRLIGDEQEPDDCEWLPGHMGGRFLKAFPEWFLKNEARPSRGRYCFTTWNYFTKDSPLLSAGLLGPVRIMAGE